MNTLTPKGIRLVDSIIKKHDDSIKAALIPTPRRLVDIIGANRPWLTFSQCMEIAQDVHKELLDAAGH